MNIKKIGLTALAGSLVATSAMAGEMSISGGAKLSYVTKSGSIATTDVSSGFAMDQELTASGSAELDNGYTVSVSHGLATGGSASDTSSLTIDMGDMGAISYNDTDGGAGLRSIDDVMPTAYEEVFALTKNKGDSTTVGGNIVIAGVGGDGLWRYDSPSVGGVTFSAAYQNAAQTGSINSYSDMGIKIAPEAVEGLEIGYATGEFDEAAGTLGIDVSTMYAKYTWGSFTVGYQQSENDGPTSTDTDESDSWGVSYAVNDDFSVSYGQHTLDLGSSTSDQESSGFSASYTMGGTTISAAFNETDNIRGVASNDEDSYEIALSFAF